MTLKIVTQQGRTMSQSEYDLMLKRLRKEGFLKPIIK